MCGAFCFQPVGRPVRRTAAGAGFAPPAPAPAFAWTSLRVAQKAASNATSPDTPTW